MKLGVGELEMGVGLGVANKVEMGLGVGLGVAKKVEKKMVFVNCSVNNSGGLFLLQNR